MLLKEELETTLVAIRFLAANKAMSVDMAVNIEYVKCVYNAIRDGKEGYAIHLMKNEDYKNALISLKNFIAEHSNEQS